MSSSPRDTAIKYSIDIDIPRLIKAVKKRPGLYDSSMPGYRDRCTKKNLWDDVCVDVCTPGSWNSLSKTAQGEFCFKVQKKWHSLRNCYRRELSIQYKKKMGHFGNKIKRTYYHFKALDFLRPHCTDVRFPINILNTDINQEDQSEDQETELDDPLDEESDVDNESASPSSSQNYEIRMDVENIKAEDTDVSNVPKNEENRYNKSKRHLEVEYGERNSEDEVENARTVKRKNDKDDGDEEFLKSLLPTLREFTSDQNLMLRIEIMKTILEFKKTLK